MFKIIKLYRSKQNKKRNLAVHRDDGKHFYSNSKHNLGKLVQGCFPRFIYKNTDFRVSC